MIALELELLQRAQARVELVDRVDELPIELLLVAL